MAKGAIEDVTVILFLFFKRFTDQTCICHTASMMSEPQ
ncbi:hypothetical protein IMCC14465_15930 [alpha proteobacterium IMCC14465]|uniref:Uncharacterized protein n=1 Tax=alpha proteobacterium IMCC14465 TaxID=1220535 RepID=J9DFQ3_9PROT|nr:hypothetical protein IMCC14465_15930 [alpha proteobacterium IMCC14465]